MRRPHDEVGASERDVPISARRLPQSSIRLADSMSFRPAALPRPRKRAAREPVRTGDSMLVFRHRGCRLANTIRGVSRSLSIRTAAIQGFAKLADSVREDHRSRSRCPPSGRDRGAKGVARRSSMSFTVSPVSEPYAPPAVAETQSAPDGRRAQQDANRRRQHPRHAAPAPAGERSDLGPEPDAMPSVGTLIDVHG